MYQVMCTLDGVKNDNSGDPGPGRLRIISADSSTFVTVEVVDEAGVSASVRVRASDIVTAAENAMNCNPTEG
jgi:hypothetical protein